MSIKDHFVFSQSSLQDFLDCPRRFELKYVQNLKWPAQQFGEEENYRHFVDLGSQFHNFVHQYFIGISPTLIQSQIYDPELSEWWNNFLNLKIECQPITCFPETTLGGNISGRKIIAKYDLVINLNNKILIYDWKTSQKRPSHTNYLYRIQTKLYQCLMVESGKKLLNNTQIVPEEIEMVYWFSSDPDNPIILNYSKVQFNDDMQYLSELINQISQIKKGDFQLTDNQKYCSYCVYRSLCDRGQKSGQWNLETELMAEDQLDYLIQSFENELEQISETWI